MWQDTTDKNSNVPPNMVNSLIRTSYYGQLTDIGKNVDFLIITQNWTHLSLKSTPSVVAPNNNTDAKSEYVDIKALTSQDMWQEQSSKTLRFNVILQVM